MKGTLCVKKAPEVQYCQGGVVFLSSEKAKKGYMIQWREKASKELYKITHTEEVDK